MQNGGSVMNGNSSNNNNNNAYQPQLRSKTPTTDRVLFQNSLANQNNNDYLYLNGTNGHQQNNNKQQQNNLNDLYSTVPNTRTNPTNNNNTNKMDQIDNGNTMIIAQRPQHLQQQPQIQQTHIPIYDSTTNIQHQRVLQNVKPHQQQMQAPASRSKTPGPDMIYFRNDMAYTNGGGVTGVTGVNGTGKSATISAGTSRSKTPTADIMYYPTNYRQGEFSGTQSKSEKKLIINFFLCCLTKKTFLFWFMHFRM